MLIFDKREIGNKLLEARKRAGLTQAELAERAGLADRTYADIERGGVNMRLETLLRICQVLHITPDDILTSRQERDPERQEELISLLKTCDPKDRATALRLLEVFLQSLS